MKTYPKPRFLLSCETLKLCYFSFFLSITFIYQPILIKISMNVYIKKLHIIPLLCQNFSCTFVYGPILMKICINTNIMKTQFFQKCHFYVMEKFCDFFNCKIFWPNYNLDLRTYVWPVYFCDSSLYSWICLRSEISPPFFLLG